MYVMSGQPLFISLILRNCREKSQCAVKAEKYVNVVEHEKKQAL